MRAIPRVVYRAGFSREQISLLAPAVAEAARTGDVEARRIMATAGEELARTALGVMRQLFQKGDEVTVYLTGGVFSAGDCLLDPFRTRFAPNGRLPRRRFPRFPPAVGGLDPRRPRPRTDS